MKKIVKTRFAPSPTGNLHIGGVRTALYSYALAKSNPGGVFILRIEDTDRKRLVEGSREKIESALQVLGLNWDEYFVQSERVKSGVYQKAAETLLTKGVAFYCDCKPKNAKKEGYTKVLRDPCRDKGLTKGAIKLKVPDHEKVSFFDYVIGKEIAWDTTTIQDPVLLKSDGFPTYHLAVVVDDCEMGITHALRGYDWLPSTPIHLLVYKYLELSMPEIGHLTDILDPDGGKLSKRKGSVSFDDMVYVDGYLPEAMLNFVMLLGWAPKDNREFFTLLEFVEAFDPKGFQKANPIFNRSKLDWFNSQYIAKLSANDLFERLEPFVPKGLGSELIKKIIPLVNTRMKRLSEFSTLTSFFVDEPEVSMELFSDNYQNHLKSTLAVFEPIGEWTLEKINSELEAEIARNNYQKGKFFMDLRVAITGVKITPPINDSIAILGKDKTIARIRKIVS